MTDKGDHPALTVFVTRRRAAHAISGLLLGFEAFLVCGVAAFSLAFGMFTFDPFYGPGMLQTVAGLGFTLFVFGVPATIIGGLIATALRRRRPYLAVMSRTLAIVMVGINCVGALVAIRLAFVGGWSGWASSALMFAGAALFLAASVVFVLGDGTDRTGPVVDRRVVMALLSVVAVAVLYAVAWPAVYRAVACTTFQVDRKAWSDDDKRRDIAHRIVACGTFDGMRRGRIEEVLGSEPDSTDSTLTYYAGFRGFGVETLRFDFDSAGRMAGASVENED